MTEGPRLTARADGRPGLQAAELEALLGSVAGGSQPALAQLYDRTSRAVFALALKILRDRQNAEEVVLDVFLQIWKNPATFDRARGRPLGWILTISRSRALDALRSRTVRRRGEEVLIPDEVLAEASSSPAERASRNDRSERLVEAIAGLPEDQASAVELAYFEGLSHAEIAQRLGLPLGTIKTRIRLGMLKLRDRLKPLEDE